MRRQPNRPAKRYTSAPGGKGGAHAIERARRQNNEERARAEKTNAALHRESRRVETELGRVSAKLAAAQAALACQEPAATQYRSDYEAECATFAQEIERLRSAYKRSANEQDKVMALTADIDSFRHELEQIKRSSNQSKKAKPKRA